MRRRISGTLLLFCLIAPIITTCAFFYHQKRLIRKEIKHKIIAGIHKDELVLLKFTNKESVHELRWKHSREFEYKGQMYDVVDRQIVGDTIFYWCWWDNKETKLNQQLDELLANALDGNHQNQENNLRLLIFYKCLYFQQGSIWKLFVDGSEQAITYYAGSHMGIYEPPPVPPPEIA